MSYVDGFVAAVPEKNKDAYIKHAEEAAKIFLKFGALHVRECWGDEVPPGETTDFAKAVKAEDGEVVVFSWIEWPDKATRDRVWKESMPEIEEAMKDNPMPFDGKRMIYGGFAPVVTRG